MGWCGNSGHHRAGCTFLFSMRSSSSECGKKLCLLISTSGRLETTLFSGSPHQKSFGKKRNCKIGSDHLGKGFESKKVAEEGGGETTLASVAGPRLASVKLHLLRAFWELPALSFHLMVCLSLPASPQPYFFLK